MLKLIIEDDEGRKTEVPFVGEEITIGRQEGNTVQLTERNVSRRHARLLRYNDSVVVEDLGSYNGIRVNGAKIQGRSEVGNGDLIQIGDYDLAVESEATKQPPVEPLTTQGSKEAPIGTLTQPPSLPQKNGTAPTATGPSVFRDNESSDAREQKGDPVAVKPSQMPRLVLLNTNLAGKEFTGSRSEMIIGRDDDNDVVINHYSVAPAQAKLAPNDQGSWELTTLDPRLPFLLNGISRSQALPQSGDIIQLGSVQLRFVESGSDSTAELLIPRTSTGLPLWASSLVVALLAFAIGGAFVWTFHDHLFALVMVPKVPSNEEEPSRTGAPPSNPDSKQQANNRLMAAAQIAYDKHDFSGAAEILKGVPADDSEVAELLEKATYEASAATSLASAKKSFAAGKWEETRQILEGVSTTEQVDELEALEEKLLSASTAKQISKPPARARATTARSNEEAQALYDEGKTLFLKRQYPEAQTLFTKCIEVDPSYAYCYMMLGSTFAKLGEPELGAQHYRQFIKLAPGDNQASKVRAFITQYEESKRNNR